MAIRQIFKNDAECLYKKCRPVERFDKKLSDLIDDMADTMYEAEERFALGLKDAILQALKAQGADERELLFMVWGEAPIKRIDGKYRRQIVLKLARTKHTPKAVDAIYSYSNAHRSEYFCSLELNPGDMF